MMVPRASGAGLGTSSRRRGRRRRLQQVLGPPERSIGRRRCLVRAEEQVADGREVLHLLSRLRSQPENGAAVGAAAGERRRWYRPRRTTATAADADVVAVAVGRSTWCGRSPTCRGRGVDVGAR